MPLVTVIITVHDRTQYVRAALESVLAQTHTNLQIIVSADSSAPDFASICADYLADPRVTFRCVPQPHGAPGNLRGALPAANGEFLCILNDDDVMEAALLERLLPALVSNPRCVLSFCDHWIMNAAGQLEPCLTDWNTRATGRAALKPGPLSDPLDAALHGTIPLVMGCLIRRAACEPAWLVPEVQGAYDQWLAIRLALTGGTFHYLPERLFRYRVHAASESARLDPEKASAQVWLFKKLLAEPLNPQARRRARRILAHYEFVLGRDRLYAGRTAHARHAFITSLQHCPSPKPLLGVLLSLLPAPVCSSAFGLWRQRPR